MFPLYTRISSDDIRQELMGNQYVASRGREVWAKWYEEIEREFRFDNSGVIADATNLAPYHRQRLRQVAYKYGATTHVFVFKNIGQAVRRNLGRDNPQAPQGSQRVPDGAMMNFVMLYESMLTDIETEKYDSVTFIERTA